MAMRTFLPNTPPRTPPRSPPRSPLPQALTPWARIGPPAGRCGDTSWAEGVRGIAALGVVASHLTLSFALDLVRPGDEGPDGSTRFFQRPVIRIFVHGNAAVALFFVLTGFVNSIKPLKQSQANDLEGALLGLAKSSFNRIPRLVLPAVAVTVIAWFACQLGFFEIARSSDAYWLRINSPAPSASWGTSLEDLVRAVTTCWLWGENIYDQPQWALLSLVRGSIYIFILLLITLPTRPTFRLTVIGLAYAWSWIRGDGLIGLNVFAGMFLAELHVSETLPQLKSKVLRILPFFTALLGVYFMCYPSDFADWKPWTRQLKHIGEAIFPSNGDFGRFWSGIGAQILCLSVQISPDLREIMSLRCLTFLGQISFSMYVLHSVLMRSVLAWAVFGPGWLMGHTTDKGRVPQPAAWLIFLVLPMFGAFLLAVSSLWTTKVEPFFARATKSLNDFALPGLNKPALVK